MGGWVGGNDGVSHSPPRSVEWLKIRWKSLDKHGTHIAFVKVIGVRIVVFRVARREGRAWESTAEGRADPTDSIVSCLSVRASDASSKHFRDYINN